MKIPNFFGFNYDGLGEIAHQLAESSNLSPLCQKRTKLTLDQNKGTHPDKNPNPGFSGRR